MILKSFADIPAPPDLVIFNRAIDYLAKGAQPSWLRSKIAGSARETRTQDSPRVRALLWLFDL